MNDPLWGDKKEPFSKRLCKYTLIFLEKTFVLGHLIIYLCMFLKKEEMMPKENQKVILIYNGVLAILLFLNDFLCMFWEVYECKCGGLMNLRCGNGFFKGLCYIGFGTVNIIMSRKAASFWVLHLGTTVFAAGMLNVAYMAFVDGELFKWCHKGSKNKESSDKVTYYGDSSSK